MKEDTAGRIHRERYGKSDKLNAIENRNNEFRDGYAIGVQSLGEDTRKVVEAEEALRKKKLGMIWAAALQNGGEAFARLDRNWLRQASET